MPQSPATEFRSRPRCEALEDRITPAVHVRFDYTYDTLGYFNSAERRAALDEVAAAVTAQIGDSLTAIAPTGANTWQARTWNSATNSQLLSNNLAVNADEIVVYITAGNIGGSELGIASGAGYSASGSQEWLNGVRNRGQAGVDSGTDYATWGGLIAFNSSANFSFNGQPGRSQYDFKSVASHELLHIFGFGLQNPSFTRYAATGSFTGPNVEALTGYAVRLQPGESDHFASGTKYLGQESVMTPSVTAGQVKHLGALEYAALRDIGWSSTPSQSVSVPAAPIQFVPALTAPVTTSFIVGGGEGGVGTVTGYGAGGQTIFSSIPFGAGFLGGVRVAIGDVNGDGVADLIAAAGPGGGPRVVVLDGVSGQPIASFFAFDAGFVDGIYVATADFNHDGYSDIVVAAGFGAGPHVKVFSGKDLTELASFYTFDPGYIGGLEVATGDVNGDGTPDLVVAAIGGAIATFDGSTIRAGKTPSRLTADFLAFDFDFKGRVSVAVGDLNGDGFAEIIVGAGIGSAPRIAAFNGRELLKGRMSFVASFYAGDPNSHAGVRVAAADLDGDGRDDIIAAPLAASDSQIRVYGSRNDFAGAPPVWMTLQNSAWATYGTYVG